jgi:hypothetical protein
MRRRGRSTAFRYATSTMTLLDQLSQWYRAQCDGDWEHAYGVVIETMDNPGWRVKVDLRDTILEHAPFETFRLGDDEAEGASWIICEKKGTQFHGMGDPAQLDVILKQFLDWAQRRENWLALPSAEDLKARDDNELWDLLGASRGEERCRADGCAEFRIRHSIYCRSHHWTNVLQRPLPAGKAQ